MVMALYSVLRLFGPVGRYSSASDAAGNTTLRTAARNAGDSDDVACEPPYWYFGLALPGLARRFYPFGLPADALLGFYARHSAFAEINSTFYGLPSA
jgi:hypothetical protein